MRERERQKLAGEMVLEDDPEDGEEDEDPLDENGKPKPPKMQVHQEQSLRELEEMEG